LIKKTDGFELVLFDKTKTDNSSKNEFKANFKESSKISKLSNDASKNEFLRETFFYSILANYSLYGLNTNETGIWLRSIFHKNDGYRTPIVLNPMRTKGKIDVNSLTYLSKSRLLGSVFVELEEGQKELNSLRNLVNNKIVDRVILNLDFKKFLLVDENNLKIDQIAIYLLDLDNKSIYLDFTERFKKSHFRELIKAFYPNYSFQDSQLNNGKIKKITIEYILKKAYDIVKKYPQFKAYKNSAFRKNSKEETIRLCCNSLSDDFTHCTFKLRQALNFLIYDYYDFDENIAKNFLLSNSSKKGIADIINSKWKSNLAIEIKENEDDWGRNLGITDIDKIQRETYRKHNLVNYLPPSFFEIDFKFKENGAFNDLSSGEKQMIYSINAITYHLINLDSISDMEFEEEISYKYFNIVLDEIELYFHPEFQRIYINELIKSISYVKKVNYRFNIIFLTHSPFILSDIPHNNILGLDNGNSRNSNDNEKSFGANIHELLGSSFFLENGFVGEYVKQKIEFLAKKYNGKNNSKLIAFDNDNSWELDFINLLDDKLIRDRLLDMYYTYYESEKESIEDLEVYEAWLKTELERIEKLSNDKS